MFSASRSSQAGVTLVEVLVAMALFAMIGLAGFSMLDAVLRVQAGTDARLERLADIDRALIIISRDLQQKDAGPILAGDGKLSFSLHSGDKLEYRVEADNLLRSAPRRNIEQRLLDQVSALEVRLLDTTGVWHTDWPAESADTLSRPARASAVELGLRLSDDGGLDATVIRLVDIPQEIGR